MPLLRASSARTTRRRRETAISACDSAPPSTAPFRITVPSTGRSHSTAKGPLAADRSTVTSPPSGRKTKYSLPGLARQIVRGSQFAMRRRLGQVHPHGVAARLAHGLADHVPVGIGRVAGQARCGPRVLARIEIRIHERTLISAGDILPHPGPLRRPDPSAFRPVSIIGVIGVVDHDLAAVDCGQLSPPAKSNRRGFLPTPCRCRSGYCTVMPTGCCFGFVFSYSLTKRIM